MTVIPFTPPHHDAGSLWQADEMSQLLSIYDAQRMQGEASGWASGATESGDPQFYILGALPEQDCTASVTRIGRLYILEDGCGTMVAESVSLAAIAERALSMNAGHGRVKLMMGLGFAWIAVREFLEEKAEPLLAESMEVAVHFFPQLATLV